jgi:hypothetical protein
VTLAERVLDISSPQTVGLAAGKWCPHGLDPEMSGDQRQEAGGSLVFDSAPLSSALDILGAPVVELELAADQPDALIAVTLSEVLPNGAATRLTYGLLNLTHRDSHERPQRLEPGKRYRVKIKLNDCGQRIGRGNRLRLAVSTSYWPIVWPSPRPVTLSIATGASSLTLPVRPPRPEDRQLRKFGPASNAPPLSARLLRPRARHVRILNDLETGEFVLERFNDEGLIRIEDIDWEWGQSTRRVYSIKADDPLSATASISWRKEFRRDGFHIRIVAETRMTAAEDHFVIIGTLDAYEGHSRSFSKEWTCRIPRDHV